MGIQEDLTSFIQKHKVLEKGKPYTNTSLGNPKASIYIPDEEYTKFLNLYGLALTNGMSLHYTEKPIDPSPLRVDLDFRFPMYQCDTIIDDSAPVGMGTVAAAGNSTKVIQRIYKQEHVFSIIDKYFKIINKYVEVPEDCNIAYIMEKPKPSEYRNKIKDGIHIVFPHIIVSNNVQHFIRKKILDNAKDMFGSLPLCNEPSDIIDKAIIDQNCWLMYGSKKQEADSYRVSSVYTFSKDGTCGEVEAQGTTTLSTAMITPIDEIGFIKLFSMRKTEESRTPVFPQFVGEVDEYIRHILPAIDTKYKTKLHNNIFAKSLNINKNYTTDDELMIIRRLVLECLSNTRAEKYEDWINLGWVLRNIDYRLLDTWVEFSKIGSSYVEGECQKLWNKMRKDHMGIGTLKWWAKQDNVNKYEDIINDSVAPLIDIAVRSDGAHYDIAKVVQAIYKDEVKTVNKTMWYLYNKDKHRWNISTEGAVLRNILSEKICRRFINRSHYYTSQGFANENPEQKDLFEERAKKSLKIALNLKNATFKDHIMREVRCLFMDEKFEELLDSRSHLIGFANGVYDLKMHIFRDGMPDDYIFHSTKMNYMVYNADMPEIEEINDFFSKIFVNEAVRNYVLDILACTIDGSIAQERFYIFTGQGSNGKSRLLDLVQKAVGDYYCILPIALLTQKRAASNSAQSELERTKGRRFAVMQEPSEQDRINIGFMKELSGNDRILTRGLYKEPFEFKPQFKMILTCNELPEVPSDDGGTWRRIRVIEFKSRFCDNPVKENEFAMDLELSDKFERWAEPFMSMLIERHKYINPNAIHEPMEVRIATESYKNNNDVIGQFISERIEVVRDQPEERINITNIFNDFRIWSAENLPKGKKRPDRNQIKAYFEKMMGAYPLDNKGWRGLKYKDCTDE
jgi:P4 family phage/plasmid primase-like protien